MRPISSIEASETGQLSGLLFDLDDTLLDHGRLTVHAFEALCRLAEHDIILIGVTGRPTSWGQVLVRQWPVRGMVTENGLVACRLQGKRVLNYDPRAADRAQLRARLLEVAARIQRQFPELQPTDDCSGRHADYTFDIGESQTVDPKVINDASAMAHELGARTTRSSVHLHLSFDPDDKASGSLRFINDQLQISPTRARRCFAFIGDSQNDAACFAAFKTTVGVANLRGQFSIPPRFITAAERSAGFVEAARVLFPAAFSQDRSEH